MLLPLCFLLFRSTSGMRSLQPGINVINYTFEPKIMSLI